MTNKELEKRAAAIESMIVTLGWNDVVLPWIQDKIKRLDSIKKINPENIEKDYLINRTKVDVYEGFLNYINNVVKEGTDLQKLKKNLRR